MWSYMVKYTLGTEWIDGFWFCIELLFVVLASLMFFTLGFMRLMIGGVIKW